MVRLTEELEDKTAQIEKLKTTAPVQTTSIGSSVELDTARANIKSAKEQILTLETRIASLEDENGIISDAINLVRILISQLEND